MALDTRDYWKEKYNKKTAYTEKADFRVTETEFRRRKRNRKVFRFFEVTGYVLFVSTSMHYLYKHGYLTDFKNWAISSAVNLCESLFQFCKLPF